MVLDEGPEVPRRERPDAHVGVRRHGGRARHVGEDERDLAEVVAGMQAAPLAAVDRDRRLAVEDDEERDPALALRDDVATGGDVALAHRLGEAGEGAVVDARQEGDAAQRLDGDRHGGEPRPSRGLGQPPHAGTLGGCPARRRPSRAPAAGCARLYRGSAMIVAIDGPAGAGKSTVARAVARALRFRHLDTGAMYRALALAGERDPATVDVRFSPEGRVLLDGRDVEDEIRTPQAGRAASLRAADPAARAALRARQREAMADGDWVAEVRDIGTVVAPDADVKVWLTASLDERARRRGVGRDEVAERDERDASREHAPMMRAPEAVEVDTTDLTIDEVVERIVALARDRGAVAR